VPEPNNFRPRGRGRPRRVEVYHRLDVEITDLRQRLGGLPAPEEAAVIWHGIWLEEAHHSTAIEGNTLVLKQVAALLDEGRAVGSKELREYLEVRGYADAADWVYGHGMDAGGWTTGGLVTLAEIRHVHKLALDPVWQVAPHADASARERPGSFRQHDIEAFPGGMQPPSFTTVATAMNDWVDDVCRLRALPGIALPEALAHTHALFERIHPFLDGNGRAGRLILNLVLVRLAYPPAIIYKRQRERYLAAIRRADAGDAGPLAEFIARAVLDNLHRFVVPAVAGPARLVPLPALASSHISANALRVAATRGRLKATRGPDGTWRSSRAWVDEYLARRYARSLSRPSA
jgi:fido (protein-threonine AMPylation protein)